MKKPLLCLLMGIQWLKWGIFVNESLLFAVRMVERSCPEVGDKFVDHPNQENRRQNNKFDQGNA